jgi:hypothetical protein
MLRSMLTLTTGPKRLVTYLGYVVDDVMVMPRQYIAKDKDEGALPNI